MIDPRDPLKAPRPLAADDGAPVCLETDPLDLFLDGDLIGARGTTLGGDDGIAVAMILAILADDALPHPALEAVFTTDEEVGLLGADDGYVGPAREVPLKPRFGG